MRLSSQRLSSGRIGSLISAGGGKRRVGPRGPQLYFLRLSQRKAPAPSEYSISLASTGAVPE